MTDRGPRYAELHAHSAFSFLDGASQPEELAAEASRLGLEALAVTDHDGLYGVVRFAEAARRVGLPTVFGAELHLPAPTARRHGREPAPPPGPPVLDEPTGVPDPRSTHLLVLARGPDGYRALSRAIAEGHLRTGRKGAAEYDLEDLAATAAGQWLVLTGCRKGAVRRALAGGDPSGVQPVAPGGPQAAARELDRLVALFGRDNVAVELTAAGDAYDDDRSDALAALARDAGLPLVATTAAHHATPRDADLAAALAAVRARSSLDDLDGWLAPAGAHLRSADEMLARHRRYPQAVTAAADLAAQCAFDLSLVAPALPPYPVPDGHTEASWLRELVWQGALELYGPRERERVPGAYAQLEHELRVITELGFAGYFLVVYDLVAFCRRNGILAQGRGSAANSAVCYALRVTAVDAVAHGLLFERFLAPERDGPPDIDVDIESARREEVIQHVYATHGRTHAAQVANVISYRPRSAVRDAARALGYDVGQQDAWAKSIERWGSLRDAPTPSAASSSGSSSPSSGPSAPGRPARAHDGHAGPWPVTTARHERLAQRADMWGADPGRPVTPAPPARARKGQEVPGMATADGHDVVPVRLPPSADDEGEIPEHVIDLAERFLRLPRHLGIHSGGMVMCDRPVIEVCPVEWARMPGRTVLQWDKEDCADAGLVKFDLLGLGMLTALRIAFGFVGEHGGPALDLHALPQEDPLVYDLLSAADTVGVFQVESRAQMGTLPRLQPRRFYDIVIEVALIRPGPIQGNSVHPYIERAHGRQKVTYLHERLRPALERTLGVPLFQEQLMQMAIDAADFTPAEADQLRRAMGSKRSTERMLALKDRLLRGMAGHGISQEIGEQIFDKLKAFADFGFPESHAYSFAYLVYASAWLKVHHPAAFYAGLLAAQPMGFYSPQSLAADARRHGVEVLRPDVQRSRAQACVERTGPPPEGGEPRLVPQPSGTGPTPGPGVRTGRGAASSDASAAPSAGAGRSLAVRLGLVAVRGIGEELAQRLVDERTARGPFADQRDLVRRVQLTTAQLEALATAGALDGLGVTRREALWAAGALAQEGPQTLPGVSVGVQAPTLPGLSDVEVATADVWATGVSVDSYPTQFVRDGLDAAGVLRVEAAFRHEVGRRIAVAGVVTHRQRPGTAGGVTFLSLEDETGLLNVVCSPGLWQRFRRTARTSKALVVRGLLERQDGATNLVAEHLAPLSLRVRSSSRDFR
ncbi:PHP domain-containing protein [Cellulomonas gilvus]|uniref:Error-prone DNA polymerase n=1 Tax=Cellulomonas gilvus (strain ATCC 13127 / NRRL B-14078) TaxID=593907 RepID=F8A7I1_CELGA|nr:PHP domain-containing protein [Cellulomonas gilvus]AEI12383.1 DNA polymerase III, alpha subunit [Cellulomonas gilvus ATCC 13127]